MGSSQADVDPELAEDASALQETEDKFIIPGTTRPGQDIGLFDREYRIQRVVDPKSSIGVFMLPGGVIYEDDLLREVEVIELDGDDEDILVSDATVYPLRLNAILSRKIQRLGHITDNEIIKQIVPTMSVLDRATIVVCVRRVTHGDLIPGIEFKCSGCGKMNSASPDLATITHIRPLVPDQLEWDFLLRRASLKADKDVVAKWHIYDGERELRLANVSKQIGDKDMLTWRIMGRIMAIDGEAMSITDKNFNADGTIRQDKGLVTLFRAVKSMSQADRNALRNEFRRVEGDIDLSVQAKCDHSLCPDPANDFLIDITDRNFFFPETEVPRG